MDESAMMVEMTINNGDGDYMEQEEEWEREGLLDPAWEKQQRKVGIHFNLEKKKWIKVHSKLAKSRRVSFTCRSHFNRFI